MASRVLPSAADAARKAASFREPRVPHGWPGTYCPNFSDWRAGDIVLVHGERSVGGRVIRLAQRASRNPLSRSGRQVTHAGIYVGDGMLVEARLRHPVSERSVWEYCRTRQLQVRRLRNDGSLPDTAGDDIAAAARGHIGEPYSALAAIFSTHRPLHPAVLAGHPDLEDVMLEWRQV